MKPRHHLYLDHDLTERLDALAAKPGTSTSAIVADALKSYLGRRTSKGLDDLLKNRLDRMAAQMGCIERDLEVLLESLALFVHYQLMFLLQLGGSELGPARASAKDRFQAFTDPLGRRVASGRTFGRDLADRMSQNPDALNGGSAG